eukprot:6798145-Prymnesium_polylepis.1
MNVFTQGKESALSFHATRECALGFALEPTHFCVVSPCDRPCPRVTRTGREMRCQRGRMRRCRRRARSAIRAS